MHWFSDHDGSTDRAYVSEFTRFMETYMDKHPEERRKQAEGWSLLWDKRFDVDAELKRVSNEVVTPGYYYFDSLDDRR